MLRHTNTSASGAGVQTALRSMNRVLKVLQKPELHNIGGMVQVQLCLNTGGTKNSLSSHGL